MKRIAVIFTVLALAGAGAPTRGQTPSEFIQTAAFAAAHQNPDGGFAAKPGQLSSLGATNSGLRVLKHVGGSVPNVFGCIKYVKSCRDASGGFAPMPGGKPDVITTALGLMAASELKIADPTMIKEASDYLGKNAKSFEEVRLAIAGHEAVKATSPDFPRWRDQLESMRNPDGTWGEGPAQAFATGGAGAAHHRFVGRSPISSGRIAYGKRSVDCGGVRSSTCSVTTQCPSPDSRPCTLTEAVTPSGGASGSAQRSCTRAGCAATTAGSSAVMRVASSGESQ